MRRILAAVYRQTPQTALPSQSERFLSVYPAHRPPHLQKQPQNGPNTAGNQDLVGVAAIDRYI